MKLIIGSDHGAVDLKEEVKRVLKEEFAEVEVEDVGTFGTESVDYPDIAEKVCTPVANGEADRGIVLCGTGIGISIAANKIKGIRAALCHETYTAKMSREHNNANVLAMGGRTTGFEIADEIVRTWMKTEFAGGRHPRARGAWRCADDHRRIPVGEGRVPLLLRLAGAGERTGAPRLVYRLHRRGHVQKRAQGRGDGEEHPAEPHPD